MPMPAWPPLLSARNCGRRSPSCRGRRWMMTRSRPSSVPTCAPRYATPRNPARATWGARLAEVAAAYGKPLLPWQRVLADVALELDDDGHLAFREVVVV